MTFQRQTDIWGKANPVLPAAPCCCPQTFQQVHVWLISGARSRSCQADHQGCPGGGGSLTRPQGGQDGTGHEGVKASESAREGWDASTPWPTSPTVSIWTPVGAPSGSICAEAVGCLLCQLCTHGCDGASQEGRDANVPGGLRGGIGSPPQSPPAPPSPSPWASLAWKPGFPPGVTDRLTCLSPR